MAVVFEETLKRSLKDGKTNVYILFGDDGYLKKMYKDKISHAVSDPEDVFNFNKFGPDCDFRSTRFLRFYTVV